MKKLIILCLITSALISCKQKSSTSITLTDVVLTGDAPYFEGPNSFQAKITDALKSNDVDPESVNKIELTSANIVFPGEVEDGLIQDCALLLVSTSSAMKKIAYINPVPAGKHTITLTIAREQDGLEGILLNEEFIALLDANFSKDVETDLAFKVNLTFNIITDKIKP